MCLHARAGRCAHRRALLLVLCVFACALIPACAHHPAGVTRHDITLNGRDISYRLFVPDGVPATRDLPLVVALHRFSENAEVMARMTGFDDLAQREKFAVVYPDGPGLRFDFTGTERDDVALVLGVVDDVSARLAIDERRVYATGASNGGFMAFFLAHRVPERFAAVAPVMAQMVTSTTPDSADAPPVPVLMIYGDQDRIIPPDAERLGRMRVMPVRETARYWRERNGCVDEVRSLALPDADPDDGTRTLRRRWHNQDGDVMLEVYSVAGAGHTWPGGVEPAPGFLIGRVARDFSASEVIWAFFEKHSP